MNVNNINQTTTNMTAGTNATVCPDCTDAGNEFSIRNVVGLFLTLSLCLLTQPYGSLLYRPLGDSFSSRFLQRAFFLWRLNPLACVGEAIVVAYSILLTLWSAMKEGYRILPSLQVSWRFPFVSVEWEDGCRWRRHFHLNAAALLLLRANDHGSVAGGGLGVLEKLLSASFLDHATPLGDQTEGRQGPGEAASADVAPDLNWRGRHKSLSQDKFSDEEAVA